MSPLVFDFVLNRELAGEEQAALREKISQDPTNYVLRFPIKLGGNATTTNTNKINNRRGKKKRKNVPFQLLAVIASGK